ncbi:MAG: winged helix-turn-helix domain-containing protein [Phormidium sp.]
MTRIAHLQPHLSERELKNRYWRAMNLVEARRWHLLWLISQKMTIREASIVIGMNYDYAREIVKLYNQQGEEAIIKKQPTKKKRPNHALLNAEQLEELRLSLKGESPDKGIWTGPKVAQWIARRTGREKVWFQRGWDYLKQCRYSPQKPRPQHQKGDQIEQEEFKKNCRFE